MRGLGRWFSVIYSQRELLFEKLSEGVWGAFGGAFRGRSGGVRWKTRLMAEQSIEQTYYFAVWQGGVRRMTPLLFIILKARMQS